MLILYDFIYVLAVLKMCFIQEDKHICDMSPIKKHPACTNVGVNELYLNLDYFRSYIDVRLH